MSSGNGYHGGGTEGLRVCVYYRMSSDEQQLSIAQQRKDVRAYCAARGWVIVAEYIDSGKSGSKDVSKRKEFHRMIADAGKGQWRAIVCYDTSRFGRLDTIDGAPYKAALRSHGVYLETCKDGRIDWATSMGRLQDALLSERNHEYSISLSGSVLRGRNSIADSYWPVGEIPFGFDRVFVEGGAVMMRLPREKKFSKPRNWHTRLETNDTEAAVVRQIFKRFASSDLSVRGLCKELNEAKTISSGKAWTPQILLHVLRQPAYVGKCAFGYGRKNKSREAHGRVEQRVIENACPCLVTDSLYQKVQERLASRTIRNRPTERGGALSGILICGHCGYSLCKRPRRGESIYVCSSGTMRQHLGCRQWSVREADILPVLCEELVKAVDAEALARLTAKPVKKADTEVAALRKRVETLSKNYERARANLLIADSEVFAALQSDALRLKQELDAARNTLTLAESKEAAGDFDEFLREWGGTKHTLTVEAELPNQSGKAWKDTGPIRTTPENIRDLFKSLNATLTLHWTPRGDRYHRLTTGVLRAEVGGTPQTSDVTAALAESLALDAADAAEGKRHMRQWAKGTDENLVSAISNTLTRKVFPLLRIEKTIVMPDFTRNRWDHPASRAARLRRERAAAEAAAPVAARRLRRTA